jgi:hypothetical protein
MIAGPAGATISAAHVLRPDERFPFIAFDMPDGFTTPQQDGKRVEVLIPLLLVKNGWVKRRRGMARLRGGSVKERKHR